MNMVEYSENEAKKSKGHSNILERTSKATGKTCCIAENYMNWLAPKGISKTTIKNIRTELDKKGGSFISPKKRYSESCVRKDADGFSREALRRKIHYLYANRENLSLDKILVCHHATWLLSQFYSFYVLYRNMRKRMIYFQEAGLRYIGYWKIWASHTKLLTIKGIFIKKVHKTSLI